MTFDRRGLLAAGLLLALGGCATRGGGVTLVAGLGQDAGELEALKSAAADQAGLVLTVLSHGCTTKADFAFYVGRDGRAVTLAFARKRLDVCKAAPSVTQLVFGYDELGLPPAGVVRLLNPVAP